MIIECPRKVCTQFERCPRKCVHGFEHRFRCVVMDYFDDGNTARNPSDSDIQEAEQAVTITFNSIGDQN